MIFGHMRSLLIVLSALFAAACSGAANGSNNAVNRTGVTPSPANAAVAHYTYEVVKTYPHDPTAFTQGLVFADGFFFEGTGGKRTRGDDFSTSLRKVDLESGKVVRKYDLPPEYFGEGITLLDGKIYQLTWQERTGFVYDASDFKLLREFRYAGEGWGLTNDGKNLIMSNGTHILLVVDPETAETMRTIPVFDEKGEPLIKLNELEYVNGEVWANIWQTGWIVRIDPATGKLLGRIDLTRLANEEMERNSNADVLNGIAHDPASGRIFVTGKMWKRLFEITVKPV